MSGPQPLKCDRCGKLRAGENLFWCECDKSLRAEVESLKAESLETGKLIEGAAKLGRDASTEVERLEAIAEAGVDVCKQIVEIMRTDTETREVPDIVSQALEVLKLASTTPLDNAEADSEAVKLSREVIAWNAGVCLRDDVTDEQIEARERARRKAVALSDAILARSGEGEKS